jgi:hypothetical protein
MELRKRREEEGFTAEDVENAEKEGRESSV